MEPSTPSSRPASQKSGRSSRSRLSQASTRTNERTPLLAQDDRSVRSNHEEEEDADQTEPLLGSDNHGKAIPLWKKRWPSAIALAVLCIVIVLILFGFLVSDDIEEYAMQAADFKPTKLALTSLTSTGVKVQVEGEFQMDASKVAKKSVRNIGRLGTWIAHEVESGPSDVDVFLPDYGNLLVGTAKVPGIKVNIRHGKKTHISFFTDLEPGSFDDIRNIANDWIDGRLGQLYVRGRARVPLKSGLLKLGTQTVEHSMVFQGNDLPTLPAYNITKINLREAEGGNKGMGADISVVVTNDFPVQITIPPVSVDLLVDGCPMSEKLIMVGTAESAPLEVRPNADIQVNVTGHVEHLPDSLTKVCPDSAKSPLDSLLANYMHGQDATVYVNCCDFPDPSTPDWARDLLQDITVPVPFAGKDMGNMIKNFSLDHVQFDFPEAGAEPGSPESNFQVSGVVKVDINLPDEMNFPIDVRHVKADSDVFYRKKKLGTLDLKEWQKANSTRVDAHGREGPSLLVEAQIKKAPLRVTDADLMTEVVTKALFGATVMLDIKAQVSVEADTPMGQFAIREIPAEGIIPVKPIGGGKGGTGGKDLHALNLQMGNLSIVDTSPTSITLQTRINFTNPTNYSATIPYFNINFLVNGTILGQGIVEDVFVHPGNNSNVIVTAIWDPFTHSGDEGKAMGREFLSQYVSGFNTSITVQTHDGTIPAQPSLGAAFSAFNLTIPTPNLSPKKPDDDDDDDDPDDPENPDKPKKGHFIQDATMHLISSTAIFTLASPFRDTTLYITYLNATSFYEGHPSGKIHYDLPFAVPPGLSVTPRLPVDWSLGGVGYDAIRKALGGQLKLSAFAEVGVRIGHWRQGIWYQGRSIGAKVRL